MRTNLVMVIDRSGSMEGTADEASKAINLFIEEQKRVEGKAWFTMVQFDEQSYDVLQDNVKLPDVPATYQLVARSMTPLFDAIGRTIRKAEDQAVTREVKGKSPFDKTIFVIITDGQENASQEYTGTRLKSLVEQKTAQGWDFIYLGAGDSMFARQQHAAQSFATGVRPQSTVTHDSAHYAGAAMATASAVGRARSTGEAVEYTDDERTLAGENNEVSPG